MSRLFARTDTAATYIVRWMSRMFSAEAVKQPACGGDYRRRSPANRSIVTYTVVATHTSNVAARPTPTPPRGDSREALQQPRVEPVAS
jgi:hypothetical protein